MISNSEPEVAGNKLPFRYLLLVFLIFFILYSFAPADLSDDSIAYMNGIRSGDQLFHPHHLMFMPLMYWISKACSWLGISNSPIFVVLMVSRAFAALGVVCISGAAARLGCQRFPSITAASIIGLSGTLWQFSGQFESYAFLFGMLGLALVAILKWAESTSSTARLLNGLFAAVLLAVITTFHQATALAALPLTILAYLQLVAHENRLKAFTHSLMFLVISGILSLGVYLSAWKVTVVGEGFTQWMTMYTRMNSDWGQATRFSGNGLSTLLRGWGGYWFTPDYKDFYRAASAEYTPLYLGWFGFMLVMAGIALTDLSRRKHVAWVILWIVLHEGFMLWWTPWLRSMQTLALIPQGILLALGLHRLYVLLGTKFQFVYWLTAICLTALPAIFNWDKMIKPAQLNLGYFDGDIRGFDSFAGRNDLILMHISRAMKLEVFTGKDVSDIGRNVLNVPNWSSETGKLKDQRVVIDASTIIREGNDYNFLPVAQDWDRLLTQIESAAGSKDRLRGDVIINRAGEVKVVIFGIDPLLPLTYHQALHRISENLPDNYGQAAAFFASKVPQSLRNKPQLEKQDSAKAKGTSTTLSIIDGWNKGNDIADLKKTGDRLTIQCSNGDPSIFRLMQDIPDFTLYSRLRITAKVIPTGDEKSVPADKWLWEVFFKFPDESWNPSKNMFLIDWPSNSQTHTVEINLWDYPFLSEKQAIDTIRLDPANIAGAAVEIQKIELSF